MSTLQKTHDSVSRRRTSLGRNPRLSAVPARHTSAATSTAALLPFSQNTSAHSPPVWDGRINVQRKRPLRLQHAPPAVAAPAPVELVKTEKDAEGSSALPKKSKKVRKVKAPPAERASVTPTDKKKKTGRAASARTSSPAKECTTEDAATLSSTSLSTTPATTTRSIAFTAADTAASQRDAIVDACRRSNDASTKLVSTNGVHERRGPLQDEAGVFREGGCGGGDGDVLDVSSPTSSGEETEFDFQIEDTATSVAATPTSQAVSPAAAAAVAPASAPLTASSRTPAESVEWRYLSSPSLSAHDHAAAHARLAAAVSAQSVSDLQSPSLTPGRAAVSVSSSLSSPPVLEASMTPSPPPAASPAPSASTQQQQRETDVAHAEAAVAEVDFVEEEENAEAVNKTAPDEQLRDDEERSNDVHTEAAGPAPVIASNAGGEERKPVEAPRSPATAVSLQEGEETKKAAATAEAVPHVETTLSEAVKEAYKNEVPLEEDRDRAAVVSEAGSTTPPPPSAEAPTSLHPRCMTGTTACPAVGVTPASAAAATPVLPSVSSSAGVSRARARLANAPAQQQQQHQKGAAPPTPMASPMMHHRGNSFSSPHAHAVAASPARFSRNSSLAEGSPVESSVARRRARRAAVAAAAAATQQHPTTHKNGSGSASALHRSNSEPLNTRAYAAQQSQQQQKSKARSTRESSAASSRRDTPAAPSLASPPPPPSHQHDANNVSHHHHTNSPPQQPTALSMEMMDRFIYHAVTVDPPSLNERMEMPPIMERPLSYYEQGMYNRHKLHAPQHYKKALLHEQRALLRNTAWLPMTMMLDQRSGGVGAMMLDDFRHMARVIRYALERENWSAALEQRARHEAQCTQLLRAAAAAVVAAPTAASPPPAARGCDASAVSSPSAYRGATPSPKKSGYHNKDADAREMSTAAAALGDGSVLPSPTKARAAAASSPSPHKPASTASAAAQRRASQHNPDYSDSDVEETGKPPAHEVKAKPGSTVPAARGQTAPNEHAAPPAAAAAASAQRAASTPAAGMRCTAPGMSATRAASGTTSGNAATTSVPATKQRKGSGDTARLSHVNKAKDKDKKKEKSESPTFLTWLADAFGVKKSKKTAAKEEKTSPTHHKTKAEGTKAAASSTSKSAAKPDTTRSSPAAASRAEPARKSSSSSSAVVSKAAARPAPVDSKATSTSTNKAPAAAATTSVAATATTATVAHAPSPSPPLQPPPAEDTPEAPATASSSPAAPADSLISSQHNTTHLAAHHSRSSTLTTTTTAAAAASPFTDDLHVSRFTLRGGRDHHDDDGDGVGCRHPVALPPAPIPVFRLFVFHPLEVVQELKRIVWWAAVHRFFVFRVLTGSTAAAARRQQQHGVHSDLCGIDDEEEGGGERVCSVSRRRQQRGAAVVAGAEGVHVVGDGRSGSRGASASPSISPAHRDEEPHTHSHSHSSRPFHESSSSIDSGAPSVDSLDVAAAGVRTDGGGRSHHEAVYFNTVLLNLRVDRWLVRHALLTRRDAARGVVELEVTEAAEDAAAAAARREAEVMEAMNSSAEGGVADKRVASALSYFFCSETRTPR